MNDKATKDVWSHDEDTNERKKREMITETTQKRLLSIDSVSSKMYHLG